MTENFDNVARHSLTFHRLFGTLRNHDVPDGVQQHIEAFLTSSTMPLSYDPEFAAATAPFAKDLLSQPKLAVGDILGRREASEALLTELAGNCTLFPEIDRSNHAVRVVDGGTITVAEYRKKDTIRPSKAVMYIHGGGMIRSSVDSFDSTIRARCAHTGVPFFAVDYRLAPEHPFPIPVEDCYSGLQWLYEHALELGVLVDRIGIMGESAGGGLAGEPPS